MSKRKYFTILLILIIGIYSCKSPEIITIENISQKLIKPPMTEKIDYNFYVDNQEISNIDYLEFTFWAKTIFGENSDEYKKLIPKKNVWNEFVELKNYNDRYFYGREFYSHPVVGISKAQAIMYTNWRTDRIAEIILIDKKLIKLYPSQDEKNYFTIDKYKSNIKYEWLINRKNVILPIYRIPSEKEWIRFAEKSYSIRKSNLTSKKNKKVFNLYGEIHNLKEMNSKVDSIGPLKVRSLIRDENGLYDIIGNVSEIVLEEGISKGGSWMHTKDKSTIESKNKFLEPNCWTGIRNICSWELIKVE